MNKKTRQQTIRSNLDKLDFSKVSRKNHVVFNTNNTKEHEMKKASIAWQAQKKGFEYVTEAIFKNGSGIADIYLLELDWVIEILHTETKERFDQKKYPVKKIVPVRTDEDFIL